ncbi:ATP-binding cassette sub-family G member 1 [Elysia marginata]|uniref:ATP-binding cassette sub-family G member 1 n=1 Tax=Elysia marginata TaxID=1093978 RepID=A0AAV4FYJ9_9GAST|nr:ATP-binding cassette sub-family G member 1 [Elysia marginata]
MEVAAGEMGDEKVRQLITALNDGKCDPFQEKFEQKRLSTRSNTPSVQSYDEESACSNLSMTRSSKMVAYNGTGTTGSGGRGSGTGCGREGTGDSISAGGGDNTSLHYTDRFNYSNGLTTTTAPATNGLNGSGVGTLAGRLNGACFPLYRNNNQEDFPADQDCHSFNTSCLTQFRVLFIRTFMSIVRDAVAVFLGPVTGIPILLFSGFFVNFDTIPPYLQWLSYISYIRYAFEGSLQALYGLDRGTLDCDQNHCNIKQGTDVLREMDVEGARFHIDFIILCAFFVVLRIGCYLVLRWRVKAQR